MMARSLRAIPPEVLEPVRCRGVERGATMYSAIGRRSSRCCRTISPLPENDRGVEKVELKKISIVAGFIGMGPFGEMICANPFFSSPFSPGWRQCPRRLNHRRAIPGVSGAQRGAACRAISTAIRNAGPRCPASVGGVCAARTIAVWIANKPRTPRHRAGKSAGAFFGVWAVGKRPERKSFFRPAWRRLISFPPREGREDHRAVPAIRARPVSGGLGQLLHCRHPPRIPLRNRLD
jgi:hypothetical protein